MPFKRSPGGLHRLLHGYNLCLLALCGLRGCLQAFFRILHGIPELAFSATKVKQGLSQEAAKAGEFVAALTLSAGDGLRNGCNMLCSFVMFISLALLRQLFWRFQQRTRSRRQRW